MEIESPRNFRIATNPLRITAEAFGTADIRTRWTLAHRQGFYYSRKMRKRLAFAERRVLTK